MSKKASHLVGGEKFLPDAKQRQAGIFTLQTLVRGPLRLEAGMRVEFEQASCQRRRANREPRFVAPIHDRLRIAWRELRSGADMAGRAVGFPCRTRAIDRRIVCRRTARWQRIVRGRRSRAEAGKEPLVRRQPPSHGRPGAPRGQSLLQPFLQFHFLELHRRNRRRQRPAVLPVPGTPGKLLRLRAAMPTPSSASSEASTGAAI